MTMNSRLGSVFGLNGLSRGHWILLLLVALAAQGVAAANDDPGLVIELDRHHYRATARDLRSGEAGPSVPIVLGSPAHPTPGGSHRFAWVILRPSWHPSSALLDVGVTRLPASIDSPMGVAKIPFADHGSIALHGGGDRRLMGMPVSGGCVRTADADLLRLIAWLELQGGLAPPTPRANGEIHRAVVRPARIEIQ
jgi:hypothetical protein